MTTSQEYTPLLLYTFSPTFLSVHRLAVLDKCWPLPVTDVPKQLSPKEILTNKQGLTQHLTNTGTKKINSTLCKKMHRLVGDYFLLSREDLFEIGVKEKVLTLMDKYKSIARSTKDKVRQVSPIQRLYCPYYKKMA